MLTVNILQCEDRLLCEYEPNIRKLWLLYPENWSSSEKLGHTYEYQTKNFPSLQDHHHSLLLFTHYITWRMKSLNYLIT